MKYFYFLFLFFIASNIACNNSTFTGIGKKNEKNKAVTTTEEIEIESAGNEVEEVGELEDEKEASQICFAEPIEFPENMTAPTELYNWHPDPPFEAYGQVASTPAAGIIIGDTPSIVAASFYSVNLNPGFVFAIDGASGKQQWISTIRTPDYISPAIGDINNDGQIK